MFFEMWWRKGFLTLGGAHGPMVLLLLAFAASTETAPNGLKLACIPKWDWALFAGLLYSPTAESMLLANGAGSLPTRSSSWRLYIYLEINYILLIIT